MQWDAVARLDPAPRGVSTAQRGYRVRKPPSTAIVAPVT